jgi:Raf kinase inhibitor-like YbhB/YbcL family protein
MITPKFNHLVAAALLAGSTLVPGLAQAADGFALTSSSFADNDILDRKHGAKGGPRNCDGQNTSPAFEWSNAPDGTKSFAMIVFDSVGNHGLGITHWVGYGIPGSVSSLAEGEISSAAENGNYVGGTNRIKKPFYFGPCPDVGDMPHHYEFTMIATDLAPDALQPGLTREELLSALADHALGATSLVGRYAR